MAIDDPIEPDPDDPVCEYCAKPLSEFHTVAYAPHCSQACEEATKREQWASITASDHRAALDVRYAAAYRAYTAAYRAYDDASGPAERERLEAARAVLEAVTAEIVAEESARYPNGVPGGTWGT